MQQQTPTPRPPESDTLNFVDPRWTAADLADYGHLRYRDGWHAGRTTAIALVGEIGHLWMNQARKAYSERIRERLAVMEASYAEINAKLGRPEGYRYDGGPVDWETGAPLMAAVSVGRGAE